LHVAATTEQNTQTDQFHNNARLLLSVCRVAIRPCQFPTASRNHARFQLL